MQLATLPASPGFRRDAVNVQLVRDRLKTVFPADLITKSAHVLAGELYYLSGGDTDEVIVGLPPGDDLEIRLLVIEENLLEDSGILEVA